jgi:pimeloyl-ACP methyl ester carboxylesterase
MEAVVTMQRRIGEVELAWEEAGRGSPVVLLHAFPVNRGMWKPQREELSRRYRVITPDFRGHGETSLPVRQARFGQASLPEEDSTMERLAEDVRGLLDFLGLERVVLGGLSMGGYASFAFYRRYPDRVAALILADTRASADTEEGRRGREELAAVAKREGAAGVAERMLPKLLSASTQASRPQVVAAVREMILTTSPAGIVRALRGMAARPASFDLLPQIQCPTLILVGAEDTLTPPADSEAMAQAIPAARLEVIPAAGHLSNLEQPAAFNRALGAFLTQERW